MKRLTLAAFVLFFGVQCVIAASSAPTPALGQVVAQSALLDGVMVPSGTTIMSGSVVKTQADPAAIHLKGQKVMQLAPNSVATFQLTGEGLKISVQAGNLAYTSPAGQPMQVAANNTLLLSNQQTGQAVPVQLTKDVPVGATEITVNGIGDLKPGQKIKIGNEEVEIKAVDARRNVIILAAPTTSAHAAGTGVLVSPIGTVAAGGGAAGGVSVGTVGGWVGALTTLGVLSSGVIADEMQEATKTKKDKKDK